MDYVLRPNGFHSSEEIIVSAPLHWSIYHSMIKYKGDLYLFRDFPEFKGYVKINPDKVTELPENDTGEYS